MFRFRRILVGVHVAHADQSEMSALPASSQAAVRQAIQLASRTGADLTFFSAMDVPRTIRRLKGSSDEDAAVQARTHAETILQQLAEAAAAEGITVHTRFEFGRGWERILKASLSGEYDLLIIGTRDRGMASRMLFGSTANRLIRLAPIPVWVTKPPVAEEPIDILIASDLNDVSAEAVRLAVDMGGYFDVRLRILHAIEYPFDRPMYHTGLPVEEIQEYRKQATEEADAKLQQELAATDYRTLEHGVRTEIREGPADIVIETYLDEEPIDLLMIGTQARSGITGTLLGNTAERLLPVIGCSVLVLKPAGFVCPLTID